MAVDNYEIVGNTPIIYEINTSKRWGPSHSLAGKIIYMKYLLKNVKCITILESFDKLEDVYSHSRLNHVSDFVITGRLTKTKLISARNEVLRK